MALLKKEKIEEIVKEALKAVADFDGSINAYEFTHFHDQHKTVFLNNLKELINKCDFFKIDGTINPNMHYDVPLSMGKLNSWNTIQDCIDYIKKNHSAYPGKP
jgi:hypothetical protein